MFVGPQKFRSPSGSRGYRSCPNIRSLTKCSKFIRNPAKRRVMVTRPMPNCQLYCHVTSCHVMSHHVTSCLVISRHLMAHLVTSCHVISRHFTFMPRHATSCHVTSCHVKSRHVTSCRVMSRHVTLPHVPSRHVMSSYVVSHHVTSCHVTSHRVTSCHLVSRHVTSCHLASPRVTSYHVMSRHGTSWHSLENRHTVTRPTLQCQLNHSTRTQFQLEITVFVGCPVGCRFHTASAVYHLVGTVVITEHFQLIVTVPLLTDVRSAFAKKKVHL